MALDHLMTKVVVALCDGLDSPMASLVKEDVLRGRWESLTLRQARPQDYTDADSYFRAAIASSLLRKCEGLPTSVDRRAKAVVNFYRCESFCRETNKRLLPLVHNFELGFHGDQDDLMINSVIEVGRQFIGMTLRGLPSSLEPKFGPGATFHDKGLQSTILHKLSSRPARTPDFWWADLVGFSENKWGTSFLTADSRCNTPLLIEGNRFTVVPKDSTKFRGICVEPGLNVCYQLAVGQLLKQRLKRVGVDLLTAQDRHREMAQSASLSGSHATIDLSDASDTVSREFVKLMLPSGWYDLLDDLRSKSTKIDGKWVKLEKFSSMGNGFTFELETLLFLSICVMACHVHGEDGASLVATGEIRVFGDDIIVPTRISRMVVRLLKFFGFSPNPDKTFLEGPFRESCGGDFFNGQAVRPFYVKKLPTEPTEWITLANGLRRLGMSDSSDRTWRFGLLRPWLYALDALPGDIRGLRGPRIFGDAVIHDDSTKWKVEEKDGCRRVRGYLPVPGRAVKLHWFRPSVQLAAALYGVPSTGAIPRDNVAGYRKRWLPLLGQDEFDG